MFWFILGVIAAIAALLCLVGGFIIDNRKSGTCLAIFASIISAVLILLSCVTTVPTGHTGVVTTFGKVENYTLDSGVHLVAPWQSVVKMDNRIQKQTTELSCFSSDIQEVSMVYTVNFQIRKSDAMTIYSTIGKEYYKTVIVPCVTESVKTVVARYTAEQLVGMRDELASAIENDLTEKLLVYNIELIGTSVEDMDFTEAFTNAVEAKQVAQQNKLKAETEADQKVIEAEAAAQVKKVQAEAEAFELLTKAEAEAEANRKISESLTDSLIEYTYATLWDGVLPVYMSDGTMIPIFDTTE